MMKRLTELNITFSIAGLQMRNRCVGEKEDWKIGTNDKCAIFLLTELKIYKRLWLGVYRAWVQGVAVGHAPNRFG